jgi:hypothetical protein
MKEKKCFKCEAVKPLSEFYKHAQMADGHLNKCKECNKKDSTEHRNANIEKIREYDRKRGSRQDNEYLKEYRARYPNKYKAHMLVGNAIRDGKLFKEACSECGSMLNPHAHHDDYSKPLNVRWLCSACHAQWHRGNGEGKTP